MIIRQGGFLTLQVVIMPGSAADQAGVCVERKKVSIVPTPAWGGGAKCQGGRGGVSKYGPSPVWLKGKATIYIYTTTHTHIHLYPN